MIDCVWLGEAPEEGAIAPGSCFYVRDRSGPYLSQHYRDHVAVERRPIWVVIPARDATPGWGIDFCIDSHPTSEPAGAWTVTIVGEFVIGAKPDITVQPSINAEGIWHGFLTHGVLTDA